ncbi:hypothetical protein NBRC116594_15920 [Shimia sp. NS0008-38b]|uniref:hypothetical protein n=1 Tax=Shimia sp. NS0008-38b TaxID=3127653 RepID=UPI0031081EED
MSAQGTNVRPIEALINAAVLCIGILCGYMYTWLLASANSFNEFAFWLGVLAFFYLVNLPFLLAFQHSPKFFRWAKRKVTGAVARPVNEEKAAKDKARQALSVKNFYVGLAIGVLARFARIFYLKLIGGAA